MKKILATLLSMFLIFSCIPLGTVSVSASSNAEQIFAFLTSELGLNSAAACGVLANIEMESAFNPNAYGDNGRSYGICQWYDTRFASLQNWCTSNGYDYTTLVGQLNYLKKELSENDSEYLWNGKTIYDALCSVENTSQGAYDAGYIWCYDYERPSNKETRSVSRGNLAVYKYWPVYGDGTSVEDTQLTLIGVNCPVNKQSGKSYQVFGTVVSPNCLEWVQCYITDVDENVLFWGGYGFADAEKEQEINRYDVNCLDIPLNFTVLADGTYNYCVEALDDKGYFVREKNTFTVTGDDTTSVIVTRGSEHDHAANSNYTWGAWVTINSATCTAGGVKARTCYCGAVETKTTAAKGHKYDNVCDKSCNICGATRTTKHDYKVATCTKAKTCKVCGVTSGGKLGHKYTNACDTSCNVCKATRKITHKYTTVTKAATATANGYTVKRCSVCSKETGKTTIYKASKVTLSKTTYTYNGKVQKPTVTVKDSKGKTIATSNYTVTYASGRKNVGTYKVTVKFKGKYTGTKTLTFKINPAGTTVKSVTAAKKKLTVKWTKKTTQVSGYQIQYATNKKFTSAKTKTLTKNSTVSTALTGLKAKITYYVRIRTYKIVNGKNVYSSWSAVKSQKTK